MAYWTSRFEEVFAQYGAPRILVENRNRISYRAYSPPGRFHGNDPDAELPAGHTIGIQQWKYGDTRYLSADCYRERASGRSFAEIRSEVARSGQKVILFAPTKRHCQIILSGDTSPFTAEDLREAIAERRALLLDFQRVGMGDGEGAYSIIQKPRARHASLIFPRHCRLSEDILPGRVEFKNCEDEEDFFYSLSSYFLRKI